MDDGRALLPGAEAHGVSAPRFGEEAEHHLVHARGAGVSAAEGREEGVRLVRLEEERRGRGDGVLESLAGRDGVRHRVEDADGGGELLVDDARLVLAHAGRGERGEVEVRVGAALVDIAPAREVGEHGEGTCEGEWFVRTRSDGEGVVLELVDESGHAEKLVAHRSGVPEVQGVVFCVHGLLLLAFDLETHRASPYTLSRQAHRLCSIAGENHNANHAHLPQTAAKLELAFYPQSWMLWFCCGNRQV